ncbi:hypothetical protein Rcae01_04228 [Novipirellula caenicola]|uniref:Uncharacterized protein n=1 Tax=Novipirellula caenicola TaxID=1536901 RepID=A0ABP9VUE1_9BACT
MHSPRVEIGIATGCIALGSDPFGEARFLSAQTRGTWSSV